MVFSNDNLKGFVLSLLSSGFIGSSFVIKKKGLRRAAAVSGVRAGVGGYTYLLEPLWWIGMITMIIGEVANFVAYAFAPAVLVTPLGALSIIVSAVLAHIILNEKLHPLGILGCVMCISGSVIIVIHAPREKRVSSAQEIWNMATQPGKNMPLIIRGGSGNLRVVPRFGNSMDLGFIYSVISAFLLYVGSVIILVFILIFYFSPHCGHTNVVVFTGICSLMGSLSVMSVKALGTSLKLTFEGNNQLIYPETWFFMIVVATCVITQMNYLNKALDTFNTAVVSPIYYVMFTSLTIHASVIMFKDWEGQSAGSIMSEICGFIVVLSGTMLLHATKDFERSSSFRGNYTPLSPTSSTRLCSGNGELLAHEVEEQDCPYDEEACIRRQ